MGPREGQGPVNVHCMGRITPDQITALTCTLYSWGERWEASEGADRDRCFQVLLLARRRSLLSIPASYKRVCWTQRFALSELVWGSKSNYRKRRLLWQGLFHVPITDSRGDTNSRGRGWKRKRAVGRERTWASHAPGKKGSRKCVQFGLGSSSVCPGTLMLPPTAPPI